MNYRLGPLGFLASKEISAETGEASMGNFGIADQRMALVWIKEHISAETRADISRDVPAGDAPRRRRTARFASDAAATPPRRRHAARFARDAAATLP